MCLPFLSQAHQPDLSSTVIVETDDGSWVLQINSALAAYQQLIRNTDSLKIYNTPEEFKALVLAYIKDHVTIIFNFQDTIELTSGVVQLGHETNVSFQLKNVPKTINSLYILNHVFQDIHRSQGAFVILKKGFDKNQFVLNKDNNYTLSLKTKEKQFVLAKTKSDFSIAFISLVSFLVIGSLGFIYLKSKQRFQV